MWNTDCNFFILFECSVASLEDENSTGTRSYRRFWVVMIFLALIGCALIFVILDYIRNVVRFASADVMGVHNKKALEKNCRNCRKKMIHLILEL